MSAPNASDEIRGRCAVIISRLEVIAHSTGDLDHDHVMAALALVEHEVSHITNAVRRSPKGRQP
jgi:hypothetical protein